MAIKDAYCSAPQEIPLCHSNLLPNHCSVVKKTNSGGGSSALKTNYEIICVQERMLVISLLVMVVNGLDRLMAQLEEDGTNLTDVLTSFNVTDMYELQDVL